MKEAGFTQSIYSDGKVHISTPYSRLLGKAPIMVAGMTHSTVKAGFVSAILRAGYHVELAGGGHYNPQAVRSKVAEILPQIPKGVGLTLNSLYINPRQFNFQFPLWQEMRREGLPVEGFCVAAGVPSSEKAAEIITGLKDAGVHHVAFKPNSVDGIRQVVNIAAAHPDKFTVIMQWTGGRPVVTTSLRTSINRSLRPTLPFVSSQTLRSLLVPALVEQKTPTRTSLVSGQRASAIHQCHSTVFSLVAV